MRRRRPHLGPIAADPELEPIVTRREVAPDGDAPAVRDSATGSVLPAPAPSPLGAGPGRRADSERGDRKVLVQLLATIS
ncbi:hypothetical protein M3148_09310 [Georgenia satyanarayanai]|uniref:hypothetical protein n=1 Tax=Georgenia satyanarayanai TaxID=860221 RepID=UPI00203FCCC8|nr:hypothetical protein [Georgenia satyanarayanai]MCM3661185.1 hypothetical protein [Georgenia satyanarayanai]